LCLSEEIQIFYTPSYFYNKKLKNIFKLIFLSFDLKIIYIKYFRMYKLRDWVDINKISWKLLSINPNAVHLLEKNMDKIGWTLLSQNPNAVYIFKLFHN